MIKKFKNIFTTKKENRYSVDIHSHLIPGIDDGSKSMEESIALVKTLHALGFEKLITTPHIMSHRFPNSSEIIVNGLKELQIELKRQEIEIIIEAASEYYLDEHFVKLLEKKDILTFGKNYLLFEMSHAQKPVKLEGLVHEMKVAGYQPILAHPERYLFMHKDFSMYERLKDQGVLFQVNLNSFDGYYSKPVKKVAFKLLKMGYLDFIGSDTHKANHLEHFSKNYNSSIVSMIFKYNTIRNEELL